MTQGAGEGEAFTFEGGEVRLGRTADNDVVIRDPASSRSHAKISERDGTYFIEDLKSANGTLINGGPLRGRRALRDGDRIIIGDVVLEFEADAPAEETSAPAPDGTIDDATESPDVDATFLKPSENTNPSASRPSRSVRRPAPEPEPEPESEAALPQDPNETFLNPQSTPARASGSRSARIVRRSAPEPEPEVPEEPEEPEEEPEPPEDAEAPEEAEEPEERPQGLVSRRPPGRLVRQEAADEPVELTAAERARQRRELSRSAGGKAQLAWQDMSMPVRALVILLALTITGGVIGLGVMTLLPKKVVQQVEPNELVPNGQPIAESFGVGDDVTFFRPDLKAFTLQAASPTRIVGVLHYQAKDISKEEVSIELNGAQLSFVDADRMDPARQLDTVLPASVLKPSEVNTIVFDNTLNPPQEEAWRVWNLWVEIIPVPELNAESAARQATAQIDKAAKYYELRNVGADNLFRAWKTYREAWLLLESTPNRPEELWRTAEARMKEIRPELDRKCNTMLLSYQQAMNQKDVETARQVLAGVPAHFPTREHACFSLAKSLMSELEDVSVLNQP